MNKELQETSRNFNKYELSETGNNILNLALQFPEMNDKQIAEKLNLTAEWICKIKKTPAYKKAYRENTYEARSIILQNITKASKVLTELLNSKSDTVRLNTAKQILGKLLDTTDVKTPLDLKKIRENIEFMYE